MTSVPTAPGGRTAGAPRRPGPVPPAVGQRPGAPATPPAGAPAKTTSRREGLRRTPGRLRALIALSILVSLIVAACGVLLGTLTTATTSRVVERVDSILELQTARSDLVAANGTASNAFLVGGLEPTPQREAYVLELADGTSRIAALADSDADPENTLGPVAASLTTYSGLIEQARANNRQGFPVGAAYLDTASVLLAQDVLPPIDEAIVRNADAAARDLNSASATSSLLWIVVAGVVILVAIQVWLARRMRRTINPAMLVGTLVVLVAWLACTIAASGSNDTLRETRQNPYAATLATSQALSLAGEARTAESFGLIQRGSGAASEETFTALVAEAEDQLDRPAVTGTLVADALADWVGGHEAIRALDDAGDWDGAVALATDTAETAPTAQYVAFTTTANAEVERLSEEARDGFRSAGSGVTVASWTLVAAGLACAVLSWRGLNKRLEEYR
ncbi:hypothetical protein C8046_14880 [Serinibacter arcticus]|uniref:Secreted protein n=1 Tax=Serinibacter arcticus TaxID=1655435 RepID=A0A2U1ZXP7_9MICO|nr:hypothetical protein [Serinibacter arcticus]PWD51741.1 hypothetical protein C8046_14880 [Serinibacter arcticus]